MSETKYDVEMYEDFYNIWTGVYSSQDKEKSKKYVDRNRAMSSTKYRLVKNVAVIVDY